MKKRDIINLIRCHAEKDELGFRTGVSAIAKDLEENGDSQLASYVMSLVSGADTFVPQGIDEELSFLDRVSTDSDMLLLPSPITQDILGIVHAVRHQVGVNKFLFQGSPGTGKTEAAKNLARILGRELLVVDVATLVDSKLGQTQKNIAALFKSINALSFPGKVMILFDEIDAIALDRTNQNDLREMGRATTAVLKGFDTMNENVVLVATTNLFAHFDRALMRRFDFIVDFDRYSQDDMLRIAEKMLDRFLTKFKLANRDVRLFRKIIGLMDPIPLPGDLQNLIKTSVAFSDPEDGMDYFRRLYSAVIQGRQEDVRSLQQKGFTVREIGILMAKSKSGVARELQTVQSK